MLSLKNLANLIYKKVADKSIESDFFIVLKLITGIALNRQIHVQIIMKLLFNN